MAGIDDIINLLNTRLRTAFCDGSRVEWNGVAEVLVKDNARMPVISNAGVDHPILPDSQVQAKAFWQSGRVRYETSDGYGDRMERLMTAPVVLYVVGHRSLLKGACDSPRGYASELADTLPVNSIQLTAGGPQIWTDDIDANTDSRAVMQEIYAGQDLNAYLASHFAVAVSMTLSANICETLCSGTALPLCPDPAPVTVTDTTGDEYELEPGQSFTCTPCESELLTFSFPAANSGQVALVDNLIPFNFNTGTDLALSNVASYQLYLDNVPVSGAISVTSGSTLALEITRTAAGDASISIDNTGLPTAVTVASPQYEFPRFSSYLFGSFETIPAITKEGRNPWAVIVNRDMVADSSSTTDHAYAEQSFSAMDGIYQYKWTGLDDMAIGLYPDALGAPVQDTGFNQWNAKQAISARIDGRFLYVYSFGVILFGPFNITSNFYNGIRLMGDGLGDVRVYVNSNLSQTDNARATWTLVYTAPGIFALPGTYRPSVQFITPTANNLAANLQLLGNWRTQ